MTAPKSTRPFGRPRRRSLITPWTVAAAVTVVAASTALAFAVGGDLSQSSSASRRVVETGERNSMGMPVIETPGVATGTVSAGSVAVAAANWALGTVPLNTAVRPSWVLRNTGTEPVTIGEPHAEIRKGCCPGPFGLADKTIQPGQATTLSFELSMHPGMDGWHDIAVHVPVLAPTGDQTLTLAVTGDFRNG